MKAICFESLGNVSIEDLRDPGLTSPGDAVVQVHSAGLCGSDLHPLFGREPGLDVGTAMGHEFVGEVVDVGQDVRGFRIGDRVCAPFTINCGKCFYCERGLTARCVHSQQFGWKENGVGLHGAQAEYVRVPFAESTLVKIDESISDEFAVLVGDNLSTAYFATETTRVDPEGCVAIVGCGTVGLLAIQFALHAGVKSVIAIDPNRPRLEMAKRLGATCFQNASSAIDVVSEITKGRGADTVIELVGLPDAQKVAFNLLRPGGTMTVIGCHCTPQFAFAPSDAYAKNLTYRTGRCSARKYMGELVPWLSDGRIDLSWCVTHRFGIHDAVEAYDVFANRKDGCIKAVIDF